MTGRADDFAPLDDETARRWSKFLRWDATLFPNLVGLEVEEIRTDYCRLRLPHRGELNQVAGIVHGGAIATLIDTAAVPAVGQAYPPRTTYSTVSMDIQYLAAVTGDAVAEAWVTKRGRSLVFVRVEVRDDGGRDAAHASLVFAVSRPAD